jgi:tryptophan 2,3-dioxygenase
MENPSNWWKFSIDPEKRRAKITDGDGTREINPTLPDGRRLIDYSGYLGLDSLFAAQIPASENPEERIFISTHHLFEITFKQMIFDLTVVSETFQTVFSLTNDDEFHLLCTSEIESKEFWRPAILAANRLKYSAKTVLPVFFHLLDKSEGKDETFSGAEYFKFRPFLPPASGFQSAQFRLIQRAFGKGKLFDIRLFPSQEYSKEYDGHDSAALREITNRVFLREAAAIANPDADSPLKRAANLDESAHYLLTRLAQFAETDLEASPMRFVAESEIETAVDAFRRILAIHRKNQELIGEKPEDADDFDRQAVANFRADLENVIHAENARRSNLQTARAGAFYLHYNSPKGNLTYILNRLVSTDAALFGQQEDSFLSLHLKMAADRVREVQETARAHGEPEQPAGTGGGGVPYLTNVRTNLIGFFPILIAFQNLEDAPVFSWIE